MELKLVISLSNNTHKLHLTCVLHIYVIAHISLAKNTYGEKFIGTIILFHFNHDIWEVPGNYNTIQYNKQFILR